MPRSTIEANRDPLEARSPLSVRVVADWRPQSAYQLDWHRPNRPSAPVGLVEVNVDRNPFFIGCFFGREVEMVCKNLTATSREIFSTSPYIESSLLIDKRCFS